MKYGRVESYTHSDNKFPNKGILIIAIYCNFYETLSNIKFINFCKQFAYFSYITSYTNKLNIINQKEFDLIHISNQFPPTTSLERIQKDQIQEFIKHVYISFPNIKIEQKLLEQELNETFYIDDIKTIKI